MRLCIRFAPTPRAHAERCLTYVKQPRVATVVRNFVSLDAAIEQLDPFQFFYPLLQRAPLE